MRILLVHKIVGVAGSENYLLELLPALKGSGVDVEFLSIYPLRNSQASIAYNQQLEELGIKTYKLSYPILPSRTFLLKVKKIISSGKYDLVHSHLIHADLFIALTKHLFLPNTVLVSTKHGYEEAYYKNGLDPKYKAKNKYWCIAKWAEKKIEKSFAVSNGLKNLYVGLGICKKENIDVIHHGFDYSEISDVSYEKSSFQLALVGRLKKLKGHQYALQAISILKKKYPSIKLIIVGLGPLEDELKKLAKSLNITENVEFLGYDPNGKLIMASSDIVLIPSIAEGFGLVALEAFSVKKPVVAFNVPALNEIIENNISGRLIEPYDTESYATAIDDILTSKSLAETYTKNGYRKLNTYFTKKRMVSETINFYNNVLKNT